MEEKEEAEEGDEEGGERGEGRWVARGKRGRGRKEEDGGKMEKKRDAEEWIVVR